MVGTVWSGVLFGHQCHRLHVILRTCPLGKSTVTPDETIRDRLRMLVAVDESLGRIMQALDK